MANLVPLATVVCVEAGANPYELAAPLTTYTGKRLKAIYAKTRGNTGTLGNIGQFFLKQGKEEAALGLPADYDDYTHVVYEFPGEGLPIGAAMSVVLRYYPYAASIEHQILGLIE